MALFGGTTPYDVSGTGLRWSKKYSFISAYISSCTLSPASLYMVQVVHGFVVDCVYILSSITVFGGDGDNSIQRHTNIIIIIYNNMLSCISIGF